MIIKSHLNDLKEPESLSLRSGGDGATWLESIYIPKGSLNFATISSDGFRTGDIWTKYYIVKLLIGSHNFELSTRHMCVAECCLEMIQNNEDISISVLKEKFPEIYV